MFGRFVCVSLLASTKSLSFYVLSRPLFDLLIYGVVLSFAFIRILSNYISNHIFAIITHESPREHHSASLCD